MVMVFCRRHENDYSQMTCVYCMAPFDQKDIYIVHYSRAVPVQRFSERIQLLTKKLLKQCSFVPWQKSSLQTFCGRHHKLIDRYEISISQIEMNIYFLINVDYFFIPTSHARFFPYLAMSKTMGIL